MLERITGARTAMGRLYICKARARDIVSRHCESRVAEQSLKAQRITATAQEKDGSRMPEGMRAASLIADVGSTTESRDGLVRVASVHSRPVAVQEDGSRANVVSLTPC